MVAGCPKCSARYRVDADRIGPDGAKLRCTKCSAVFLVRAPRVAPSAPSVAPDPIEAETPAPPAVSRPPAEVPTTAAEQAAPAAAQAPAEPELEVDRERLVLIADPDAARGKASAEAVAGWGLQPHLVEDGVEAMLAIQRLLPRAVILDAALPKMFGFQVCEVVKRNESLRDTVVVLVGAIHHQSRYRRDPSDLYGADVYIEQPDLPDGLHAILRDGGLPMQGDVACPAPPTPEPVFEEPVAPPTPTPVIEEPVAPPAPTPGFEEPVAPPTPTPGFDSDSDEPDFDFVTEPPATPELILDESPVDPVVEAASAPATEEDPEKAEERERAERLARIAVSEMLLYQPDKFEQAARDGNLEQVLDLEIQEARALLRQRIREDVREETDFVMDELNRVAAERSGQG